MIELRVFGTPAPQGSKTAFVRGDRVNMVDGSSDKGRASHAAWRQAVATAARDWQESHNVSLLDEPLCLDVEFVMPRPPSRPKRDRWPDRKPDASKLLRAIEDALTGVVVKDDARYVDIHVVKRYASPGEAPHARITLGPVQ